MCLVCLLLIVGIASAQQVQMPMPAATIPQFVEPLPLLEFEFINATSLTLPGLLAPIGPGQAGTPFNVDAEEFLSQILPSANVVAPGWPPVACGADTASSTFGYIGTATSQKPKAIDPVTGIHSTYLGPVVIAERNVAANPVYGNNLPENGVVQTNLPIDMTLDWADPLVNSGPVGCLPNANGNYTNLLCGTFPYIGPMPIATHLHGGEVSPSFDGGPDAWFTQDIVDNGTGLPPADGIPDVTGPGYPGAMYNYPNTQQEGTIWFHDHALGITRLNVYAGLAGIQPIIDPANTPSAANGLTDLPQLTDGYDVPLIIQDRTFDTTCEIMYNLASNPMPNPTVHPFWIPEFIGDTIVVNGKTWPYFNVEPRQYRFRFVNGSNARFYELTIKSNDDPVTLVPGAKLPFLAIATDDGYLMNAVSTNMVVIGPGERYEVVVDFRGLAPGRLVTMFNSARTPYPGGGAVVKGLTDRIMQFRVVADAHPGIPSTNVVAGSPLRDPIANPIHPIVTAHVPMPPPPAAPVGNITRQLTLNEVIGGGGPLELVVNNSKFNKKNILPGCTTPACRETELPAVGDTEVWEIINISADAHPMHTHLTSFQVLSRQAFKAGKYMANYDALLLANGVLPGEGPPNQYNVRNADGAIGGNPAIGPFLTGKAKGPLPYEMGWKDTVIAYPGEVTRIAVRWAPTDLPATGPGAPVVGVNSYVGFNPTELEGPVGYVWHCHIVDHEDNEMMRNYVVGVGTPANPTGRQPVL